MNRLATLITTHKTSILCNVPFQKNIKKKIKLKKNTLKKMSIFCSFSRFSQQRFFTEEGGFIAWQSIHPDALFKQSKTP